MVSAEDFQAAGLDCALGRRDWSGAARNFYLARTIDPFDAAHVYNFGWASLNAMRWADAEAANREVLEMVPDYQKARVNLAGALVGLRRYEEARREVALALAAKPDDVGALDVLALADAAEGNLDSAIGILARIIDISPMVRAQDGLASMLLGLPYSPGFGLTTVQLGTLDGIGVA